MCSKVERYEHSILITNRCSSTLITAYEEQTQNSHHLQNTQIALSTYSFSVTVCFCNSNMLFVWRWVESCVLWVLIKLDLVKNTNILANRENYQYFNHQFIDLFLYINNKI